MTLGEKDTSRIATFYELMIKGKKVATFQDLNDAWKEKGARKNSYVVRADYTLIHSVKKRT